MSISRGRSIGRKGGGVPGSIPGLYRLTGVRNGQASTTTGYSILTADATPSIVKLSAGSNYDVIIDYQAIWKAGFSSSSTPSTRLQLQINGSIVSTLGDENYTGGSNSCASIVACVVAGQTGVISLNSGGRRLGFSLRNFAGIGYALCESRFEISILMKLNSGTVESTNLSLSPWSSLGFKKIS